MKYSKQRQEILQTVIDNRIHPTADTVYALMRQKMPDISLGTVYRNLNLLSQNGVIRKIPVPNGSDRFDSRLSPHEHMICTECGEVFDFDADIGKTIRDIAEEKLDFTVLSCSLTVYGICKNCRCKNNKGKNNEKGEE